MNRQMCALPDVKSCLPLRSPALPLERSKTRDLKKCLFVDMKCGIAYMWDGTGRAQARVGNEILVYAVVVGDGSGR